MSEDQQKPEEKKHVQIAQPQYLPLHQEILYLQGDGPASNLRITSEHSNN